jgi:hypothetical protein
VPELQLVSGPLPAELLRQVAALYGQTDGKYGSVAHCELLFNRNPFGPALHAFARDGESFVGHYCLIPYDILVGDRRVRAAKGEALHVAATHRRSQCGDLPTSSALLEGAKSLAQERGVEVTFAIVAAPGVIRLFARCGYQHRPFQVQDLLVPQTRALPLGRLARCKAALAVARLRSAEPLREVDFDAVRSRLPLALSSPPGQWRPVLEPETLAWFGQAPGNRYFQLAGGVVWLAQTHDDWEVLCTFTRGCSWAQRLRLAGELRAEATRRGVDRIRVPLLQGIESEMISAFALLARRQVQRQISLVVQSPDAVGAATGVPFLWSHF